MLFAFLVGGFAVVAAEPGLGFVAVVAGVAMTFALAVAIALVGLGAAGGYVGAILTGRNRESDHEIAV